MKKRTIKITPRGRHALAAVIEIARAEKETIPLSLVAARISVSVSYLEQLFHGLRKHGVVTSRRGPGGGYILAAAPRRIRLSSILLAAEDTEPARRGSGSQFTHALTPELSVFYGQVDTAVTEIAKRLTLHDLLNPKG